MATIITQYCKTENLSFKYSVLVNKEGIFATTLPKEVVDKLHSAGIETDHNRLRNRGFFSAQSLKDLKNKVNEIANKFSEKKLISEKIVLRYSIDTNCHYCKTKAWEIVPNGGWQQDVDGEYNWIEGTEKLQSMDKKPFGFSCYVEPKSLRIWQFPDRTEFKEYSDIDDDPEDKVIQCMQSLCDINMPYDQEQKEIDYTPELGQFFKNMILYICNINEKLREMFPDGVDLNKVDLCKIKSLTFKPSEMH